MTMKDKINYPRALLSSNDLGEALTALHYDKKFDFVHREAIDKAFTDLADELGFSVAPILALEAAE